MALASRATEIVRLSAYESTARSASHSGPQVAAWRRIVFGSARKYFHSALMPALGSKPKSKRKDGKTVIWRRSPKVKNEMICSGHWPDSAAFTRAPTGRRVTKSLTSQSGKSTTRGTQSRTLPAEVPFLGPP
jgi:hypothetical protein